ncbi:helix-turn-helix domain-containing protein [Saccharicrinis aurantiacus]|uniref:helix-turn-helix domain-containing protein n=1 Tax=Saccharicrinis aurantiacus TaxID=1849719 RepID=UPI002490EFD2|nr:helix-turn-helix domain-containing protein [Saccharicrinis aurantiacus]
MINNIQLLKMYPHLREAFHFKGSIKEVAKLLLAELIADSLNIKPKLNNKTDSVIVKKAEELIDANPEKFYRIQQIADCISTTPRNLQLAFKKHRDYSPMQFLKERKLNKARLLLINPASHTMIKQIAYDSGFLNLSSFSKCYKELFGECPSETLHNTILTHL